jgi:thioredoxin 1
LGEIREFTDLNFAKEVLDNDTPVLVDFGGGWCIPCQRIAPVLQEIALEYKGELLVGEVDVDKCPKLAMKYCVRSVPSLLIFKKGQVVDQVIGAVTKQSLLQRLQSALSR